METTSYARLKSVVSLGEYDAPSAVHKQQAEKNKRVQCRLLEIDESRKMGIWVSESEVLVNRSAPSDDAVCLINLKLQGEGVGTFVLALLLPEEVLARLGLRAECGLGLDVHLEDCEEGGADAVLLGRALEVDGGRLGQGLSLSVFLSLSWSYH